MGGRKRRLRVKSSCQGSVRACWHNRNAECRLERVGPCLRTAGLGGAIPCQWCTQQSSRGLVRTVFWVPLLLAEPAAIFSSVCAPCRCAATVDARTGGHDACLMVDFLCVFLATGLHFAWRKCSGKSPVFGLASAPCNEHVKSSNGPSVGPRTGCHEWQISFLFSVVKKLCRGPAFGERHFFR